MIEADFICTSMTCSPCQHLSFSLVSSLSLTSCYAACSINGIHWHDCSCMHYSERKDKISNKLQSRQLNARCSSTELAVMASYRQANSLLELNVAQQKTDARKREAAFPACHVHLLSVSSSCLLFWVGNVKELQLFTKKKKNILLFINNAVFSRPTQTEEARLCKNLKKV